MPIGIVAVLDALGFKGIWSRRPISEVLAKLGAARREELHFPQPQSIAERPVPPMSIRFLSDTVVLAAPLPDARIDREYEANQDDALVHVSFRAAMFVARMLASTHGAPIAYRGAISFGEFEIREDFLIGPAIDEAAEAERLAEGAFVWLCPSAMPLALRSIADSELRILMPYAVPLKGGRSINTYVVTPLADMLSPHDIRRAIGEVFTSNRIDLVIKYQNTMAMIDSMLARTSATAPPHS